MGFLWNFSTIVHNDLCSESVPWPGGLLLPFDTMKTDELLADVLAVLCFVRFLSPQVSCGCHTPAWTALKKNVSVSVRSYTTVHYWAHLGCEEIYVTIQPSRWEKCRFLQSRETWHVDLSGSKICLINTSDISLILCHACRNTKWYTVNIVKGLVTKLLG